VCYDTNCENQCAFAHLACKVELRSCKAYRLCYCAESDCYTLCLIRECQDPLEFPAHELKKFFKMGDHVKVIAGRYENDTGLIVRVEDNIVVLFSDLTMHEVGRSLLLSSVSVRFIVIIITTAAAAAAITTTFSFYLNDNIVQN